MSEIPKHLAQVRAAGKVLAALDDSKRNAVLLSFAKRLRESVSAILDANAKDLAAMDASDPTYDRLTLTKERVENIAADVEMVASLPSPLGLVLEARALPNGLALQKVNVPLGVVAVIYESRPNVTVDVFALCFKSGNACVLKGGKEAAESNAALIKIIHDVLQEHGLPKELVYLLPNEREATEELLYAREYIDVIIPRGSQQLIEFVREHSRIPMIETGAGIVHTYFDASGDLAIGAKIIENAKTRRYSVCNALDTLIIHRDRLHDLPLLVTPLAAHHVEIFADEEAYAVIASSDHGRSVAIPWKSPGLLRRATPRNDGYPLELLHEAEPQHFGTEFLSAKISIKTVANLDEALAHIAKYGSKHSEAIIAKDQTAIDRFLAEVDAAVVYANASTAFTDGAQFGMGAEIGISTQKLHARGPMALRELTTYKWLARGNGQVRPV